MKRCKNFKIIVIALVFIMLSMCYINIVNAAEEVEYVKATNEYEFGYIELLEIYSINSTGGTAKYPLPYNVEEKMLNEKTAIPLTHDGFNDDKIDSKDSTNILSTTSIYNGTKDVVIESILADLATALGQEKTDIELKATFYNPADKSNSIILSSKTSTEKDTEQVATVFGVGLGKLAKGEVVVRLDAIMPDGAEYTLVIAGENYKYNNWFMVRTKEAPVQEQPPVEEPPVEEPPVQEEPKKEFKTDLSYTAIVDGKVVDGTLKDGTYYPNYDRTKVEKDANVTAKITSTTKTDIVKINGVELKPDGTKNSLGWYYADKSDKTVIVKDYPFDTYDNLEDNGIRIEKDLVLTSIDDLTDKEDVSIEWPFRIIDLTQKPEKIDEKTEKVTFIITTNLPIEEEKLPDGWKFTDDEEGKTQHRIYKEFFKKDGNKKEDVIVIANNRDDKDNTTVKVEWPAKEELPEVFPQTGSNTTIILSAITTTLIAGVAIYRKLRK